jgi:hypothetical protein
LLPPKSAAVAISLAEARTLATWARSRTARRAERRSRDKRRPNPDHPLIAVPQALLRRKPRTQSHAYAAWRSRGHAATVGRIAHTLKGSAGNLGAVLVHRLEGINDPREFAAELASYRDGQASHRRRRPRPPVAVKR